MKIREKNVGTRTTNEGIEVHVPRASILEDPSKYNRDEAARLICKYFYRIIFPSTKSRILSPVN